MGLVAREAGKETEADSVFGTKVVHFSLLLTLHLLTCALVVT